MVAEQSLDVVAALRSSLADGNIPSSRVTAPVDTISVHAPRHASCMRQA